MTQDEQQWVADAILLNQSRDAEVTRLKIKINTLCDAIKEHTSRAAAKRIFAEVNATLGTTGDAK